MELINEHIRDRTQDPKARDQEEEEDKERTQELYKAQTKLEAQDKPDEYEPYDPMKAFTKSLQKPMEKGECPMDVVRAVRTLQGPEGQELPAWQVAQQQRIKQYMENQAEKEEMGIWQEIQAQKVRDCMEANDWQSIQKHKIRKCVEEQLATEEKMENRRQLAMEEARIKEQERLETSQENRDVEPVELETNKDQVIVDTYDTVLEVNVKEDSKGNLVIITKEPEKVMSILTNPMRDDENIDESDVSMYYRVQQAIDREMADLVDDPQQMMEEEINKRELLGKEIAEEEEKPYVVCMCRANKQIGIDNRCHNEIQVDTHNMQIGNRIRRVQDKAKKEQHKGPVHFDSEKSVSWNKYKSIDKGERKVKLRQQGECPYMKITLLGHDFNALMDSGAGLSLISKTSAEKLMKSDEWKHCKHGKPQYKTDEIVSAVNCDGQPLTLKLPGGGQMALPLGIFAMVHI